MQIDDPPPISLFPLRGCILATVGIILLLTLGHYLIPIGPGGNDTSKAQICLANLHNLGFAFAQYTQDNDGLYPRGILTSANGVGWGGALYMYVKSEAPYACPTDIHVPAVGRSIVSYGYNSNLAHSSSETGVAQPTNTILLFEVSGCNARIANTDAEIPDEGSSAGYHQFSPSGNGIDGFLLDSTSSVVSHSRYATGFLGRRPPQKEGSQYDNDTGRHLGNANFLFADSHAATMSGSSVSSGQPSLNATDDQSGLTTGFAAGSANGKFAATFSIR